MSTRGWMGARPVVDPAEEEGEDPHAEEEAEKGAEKQHPSRRS